MFELTNEQRVCFALAPISEGWERIELKASPYDTFKTYLFLDGDTALKCITQGEEQYTEYEFNERVSPDRKFLLPKTEKGNPVPLSSSSLLKRKMVGMALSYYKKKVMLWSAKSDCNYYTNDYFDDGIHSLADFAAWAERWCKETSEDDLADVRAFAARERRRVRYREGDVFRFKIGRRLYGYGRLLLDYDKLRKSGEPFWDVLMARPLVCSVYRIVTERADLSADELAGLPSLPSSVITDNRLFYGEHEIIGSLPIQKTEDYPMMYGDSIRLGEGGVFYQCGRLFRSKEDETALYDGFRNNTVSFTLNFTLPVLEECIARESNAPYWEGYIPRLVEQDLRNPKHADKLKKIKEQLGI